MGRNKRKKQNKDGPKARVRNTTTPSKKSDAMDADEENPQGRNGKERPMVKVKRYLTYLWPPYFLDLVFCSLLRVELFIYKKVAGQMPMFLEGNIDSVRSKEQNAMEDPTKKNEKLLNEMNHSLTKCTEEIERKDGTIHELENENKRFLAENQDLVKKNDKQLEVNRRNESRIEQLQADNTNHNLEIENKNEMINSLRRTQNEKENEIALLRDKVNEAEKQRKAMEDEKQDALRRLSELVSVRLRDNNPNIADLNDQFRPTKLAEMFSELYDNEWTSAYEILENNSFSEKQAIIVLLDTVMIAYGFCEQLVENSWQDLNDWFLNEELPGFQQTAKWLKDSRKSKVKNKVHNVIEDFCTIMTNICVETKLMDLLSDDLMKTYFKTCIKLCLLMAATDPPVVLGFPGWKPIQFTKMKVSNPLKQETTDELPEIICQQLEVMPTAESPGSLPSQHGEEHRQLQVMTNAESADCSKSDEKHQQAEMMPKQEKVNTVTALNEECQKPEEIKNLESGCCQQLEDIMNNRGSVVSNPKSADDVAVPDETRSKIEELNNTEIATDGKAPNEEYQQQVRPKLKEITNNPENADDGSAANGECQQQGEMTNPENAGDATVPHEISSKLEEMNNAEIADDGKSQNEEYQQQEGWPNPENADDAAVPHEVRLKLEEINNPENADDGSASNCECKQQGEMSNPENADDVTVSNEICQELEEMNSPESTEDGNASNGECQQQGEISNPDRAVHVLTHNEECQKLDEMANTESTADNTASPEKAREKHFFDKAIFREYTKRGKFLDFVVWPAMYLHKGGPLLSKGIAQGTKVQHTPPDDEVWTWRQAL